MFEISLFNKIFFRIDALHTLNDSFYFGVTFSTEPVEHEIHNGDERNEPESIYVQETSVNLWLGVVSAHLGWKGKELDLDKEI